MRLNKYIKLSNFTDNITKPLSLYKLDNTTLAEPDNVFGKYVDNSQ